MAKPTLESIDALPMNSLRVLEACARHLSFTKAAQELDVTQAAVSHHIKMLQGYLGSRLFRRSAHGVTLTQEGQDYCTAVRTALNHLDEATVKFRAGRNGAGVTCSIATTIAMRWLLPRLGGFTLQFPDTPIRLDITERYVDFSIDPVDIAIRYGDGRWPGLTHDLLFTEMLVPVCSPGLLRGKRALARVGDLKHQTLLHATASLKDWNHWLIARGLRGIDANKGLIFDQPHLALQAATDGLGVAMADRRLVQRELAMGILVMPFPGGLARTEGYYLVGPANVRERLNVGRFWRWLLAQAAQGVEDEPAAVPPNIPPKKFRLAR